MSFPTAYAGSYYPIYNSGVNQYIVPNSTFPFDQISTLLVAFAHAYPMGKNQYYQDQAGLALEVGQPDEPFRLQNLVQVAKQVNPEIKILISLGWGHNDWTYISQDYNGANIFPQTIVDLIRTYKLDGFDIDDESIGGSSGSISQDDFTGVVQNIKKTLTNAGNTDGKYYYFTITPAGTSFDRNQGVNTPRAYITNDNILCFDIINTQNYGGSSYADFKNFPNADPKNFAYGINTEGCSPAFPDSSETDSLAGMFNWTMSADSVCTTGGDPFEFTKKIAAQVGYNQS